MIGPGGESRQASIDALDIEDRRTRVSDRQKHGALGAPLGDAPQEQGQNAEPDVCRGDGTAGGTSAAWSQALPAAEAPIDDPQPLAALGGIGGFQGVVVDDRDPLAGQPGRLRTASR